MDSKNKVFLSFSECDRAFAAATIEKLESLNLIRGEDEVLTDKDVSTEGASWRDALRTTIDAASTVVLLWSKAASQSASVNYEAGMADALGKRMIVVLPEGETTPIPSDLQNVHIVELKDVA